MLSLTYPSSATRARAQSHLEHRGLVRRVTGQMDHVKGSAEGIVLPPSRKDAKLGEFISLTLRLCVFTPDHPNLSFLIPYVRARALLAARSGARRFLRMQPCGRRSGLAIGYL